jgi:hypothetical protein
MPYINKRQIVYITSHAGSDLHLPLPKGFISVTGDNAALTAFLSTLTDERGPDMVAIPNNLKITDGTHAP